MINYRYKTTTLALCLFLSLAFSLSSALAASSISIPFDVYGDNREEAEWLALVDSTQQALKKYMLEWAVHEDIRLQIEAKLKALQARQYKPLVRKWTLELDEKGKSRHYLQGRVILDNDSLSNWSKELLKQLSLDHRLTLYVAPVSRDDMASVNLNLENRRELMNALEQLLTHLGYQFKTEAQKDQAQYVLQLQDSRYQRDGQQGSVGFTVAILENRSDRSQLAKANGAASAALETTELEMQKRLFSRSSVKVAAELHRTFIELSQSDLEIVFYAPESMKKRKLKRLALDGLDYLAEAAGMSSDKDFETFEENTDYEFFEAGQGWSISYRIGKPYGSKIGNIQKNLTDIQQDLFDSGDVDVIRGSAGKKWLVFDSASPPEGIGKIETTDIATVGIEQLIREGKFIEPPGIGANAFDTLRHQLQSDADNKNAIRQLNRIAELLLTKAQEAMPVQISKDSQLNPVQRYLYQAGRVINAEEAKPGSALKKSHAQLTKRFQSLVKEQKKLLQPAARPSSPAQGTGNQVVADTNPSLVFPVLEVNLRGLTRKRSKNIVALIADADGIESVRANGKPLKHSKAEKQYQSLLQIPDATTRQVKLSSKLADDAGLIEVTVNDTQGNKKTRTLSVKDNKITVIVPDELSKGRTVLEQGNFWVLLISNQDYQHISDLKTPHHDSDVLKQVLENRYGFDPQHIVQIKDASKDQMHKEMDKLQARVKGNDSLLIFYAGHGYQDPGFGSKGFWIPVDGMSPDAQDSPRTTWLPNSTVHDILEASKARHILLISDSCYSGTFKTRSLDSRQVFSGDAEFFYKLAAKKSRRAITSGDLEPVLDGGGSGHSVFARQLINTLVNNKHALNAKHLFDKISQPVQASAQSLGAMQTPQYFPIESAGDAEGDFIFIPEL